MSQRPILRLVNCRDTFDPAEWLIEFEAAGGWYVVTDGQIHTGWMIDGFPDDAATRCRALMAELETNDRRERLRAFIHSRQAGAAA